jgi:tRNA threonylcarbamoyladenosine biosynthesis protein TsaB
MPVILSIETSGRNCSAALHQNGVLIDQFLTTEPQSHASKLAVGIQQLFTTTGISPRQIQAVAVSSGPGSYTGLRIGVATAKGLCFALGVPLLAMNTLDLLIAQARRKVTSGWLCPMIDARRMEVYCKLVSFEGEEILPMTASVIDSSSFQEFLAETRITFFGDGAGKCKQVITGSNAEFETTIFPQAEAMGAWANQKFEQNEAVHLESFEPVYLKEFRIKAPNTLDNSK